MSASDKDDQELFHEYLNSEWPLWKQHVGSIHYVGLSRAFRAGLSARSHVEPNPPITAPYSAEEAALHVQAPYLDAEEKAWVEAGMERYRSGVKAQQAALSTALPTTSAGAGTMLSASPSQEGDGESTRRPASAEPGETPRTDAVAPHLNLSHGDLRAAARNLRDLVCQLEIERNSYALAAEKAVEKNVALRSSTRLTRQEAVTLFCEVATRSGLVGLDLTEERRQAIAAFADEVATRSAIAAPDQRTMELAGCYSDWRYADGADINERDRQLNRDIVSFAKEILRLAGAPK